MKYLLIVTLLCFLTGCAFDKVGKGDSEMQTSLILEAEREAQILAQREAHAERVLARMKHHVEAEIERLDNQAAILVIIHKKIEQEQNKKWNRSKEYDNTNPLERFVF